MKLTRADLPRLWLPLAAMLALFAAAAILAWNSHRNAEQAEREKQAALTLRNQTEQRLLQVRLEEQEIKERAQLLLHLQASGVAGEERRLDWIELLRDGQRSLRLPGMKYEFGAQAPLDTDPTGSHGWFASPLRIQLRLLHENDLLNFLEYIQRNARAQVIVRSCKLAPLPGQSEEANAYGQLAADCEMQWLTVRQRAGKP